MKIIRYGIFFSSVAVGGAVVVCRPEWLAGNKFVQAFMGPDLLSLLVVILTITFASVANIHLSLNRFAAKASPKIKTGVAEVRKEINDNAWMIFAAFVVCVVSLVAKGEMSTITGTAAADAVCLLVLLVNILVMHDLYHAIFALAAMEVQIGAVPHDRRRQVVTHPTPEGAREERVMEEDSGRPFGQPAGRATPRASLFGESRPYGDHQAQGITFAMCGAPSDCEHDFQGWREFEDGLGGETVCSKCGIGAMAHTLSLDI